MRQPLKGRRAADPSTALGAGSSSSRDLVRTAFKFSSDIAGPVSREAAFPYKQHPAASAEPLPLCARSEPVANFLWPKPSSTPRDRATVCSRIAGLKTLE